MKDHEGLIYLAVKTVSAESMSSGKKMEGRVNKMQYLYDGEFRDGGIDGRYVYSVSYTHLGDFIDFSFIQAYNIE